MSDITTQARKHHLGYLDSTRGIAALMVLFFHYLNWRYDKLTAVQIACFIFNGRDAVSFFFVLSGFVLSYKYIVLKAPLDIRKFFITRFLRLFPAFFVTLVVNQLYSQRYFMDLGKLRDIFIQDKTMFWEEAYIFKTHNLIYMPDWTLVIELTASFFMPFAIALAKMNRRLVPWMIGTYMLISFVVSPFFIHFALGLFISCYYTEISSLSFRNTKWYRYRVPIIMAAFVLFSMSRIDTMYPFGSTYQYLAKYFQLDIFLYSGIAAFIFLVIIVQSQRVQRFLSVGVLRFYGKISYGIYLCHWVVVSFIFDHYDKLIKLLHIDAGYAFFFLMAVCLGLSTFMAVLMHYFVELPSIRFGKRLTDRMRPSVVI